MNERTIHGERTASEPQDRSSSVAHSIEVPSEIIRKWQEIVELLAEIMHVPSAVVMRVEPSNSVFVSSHSKPSEAGSRYCETVMKTGRPLLVPDARRDERWKSSPDIKRGMVSYLGVPISWPNGEIFGTICVYDNKSNEYSQLYLRQLLLCRDVLQADLRTLATLHSQLEQHEAKIRRLVDANIIGIIIWDLEGRILEANDAFLRMGGYDREDLISGRLNRTDLTPPEWRERDARTDAELKRIGAVQPFEKEYFRKDGGRVPVLIGLAAFGDERDQGVAFVLDLTERKRAEQALTRSAAYLAEAQKLTHTGSWVWDPRTEKVLYCSEEMFRIFGLDPRESLPSRDNFRQQIHPEDRDWVKKRFEESLRERADTFAEYRVLLPDGTVRYINASGHPVLNEDGEFIEFVGTAVDVTERKRAEVVGQRLAAIVNSSEDAIVSKDLNGIIETWNGGAERLFGYQASEVIGKSILIIIPPDRHDEELRIVERIRRGELIKSYETVRMREDGSLLDISLTVSPLRDAAGRIIGASKIARDITERKRAEAALRDMQMQLAHANRVATMGQLSASITHEVNQPITAAVTYALAARRWLSAEPPNFRELDNALSHIVKEGNRAGEVVARIRALIKKVPARKDAVAIDDAILEVIALTRTEAASNSVSVRTQFAEGLPRVQGDRVQLQQVMLNLIVNAIQAMSGIGEGARELQISIDAVPSEGRVRVGVRDTGPGLSPESLSRLFEPFYTTKPDGMGMGLSICRSIIEAHGGRLWAIPCEPQGALFQFTVPR